MSQSEPVEARPVLFVCEGRPVHAGDQLHVDPEYLGHTGVVVTAEVPAEGADVVCRVANGAVSRLPLTALSWGPHPDTVDREAIRQAAKRLGRGLRVADVSERDLDMYRLGRADGLASKLPAQLDNTRVVAMAASHWEVLAQDADFLGLSQDKALAQAVRLYQMINLQARLGLQLAFVDAEGTVARGLSKLPPVAVEESLAAPVDSENCPKCGRPWAEHEFGVPAPYCH